MQPPPQPARLSSLHTRRLLYRKQAGFLLVFLIILILLSIIPDDTGKDDDIPGRGMAFFFALMLNFALLVGLLIQWMGGCAPSRPSNDPLLPLYPLVPAIIIITIWLTPRTPRIFLSVIFIALNAVGLVAALVRCYRFESGFDFDVEPEDAGVELVDHDDHEQVEFNDQVPKNTDTPQDEESLLRGVER